VPDEDETLADLFWAVARRLRHQTRETVAPFGVTPGQARALGILAREGTMRLNVLSEHLRIVPRSGTEVVDALVALTDAGRELAAGLGAARRAEAEALFGTLAPDDREALARILSGLRGASELHP